LKIWLIAKSKKKTEEIWLCNLILIASALFGLLSFCSIVKHTVLETPKDRQRA
jgi:hypothetical protein